VQASRTLRLWTDRKQCPHARCVKAKDHQPPFPDWKKPKPGIREKRNDTPDLGLLELQRRAGNSAVCTLLGVPVQRQPMPAAPAAPTGSELNQRFQQQMSRHPPDVNAAALTLNAMTDVDLDLELHAVDPALQGELFRGALRGLLMTPPPHRVTDAIHRINPTASRQGRIDYFHEVVGASDWWRVALTLNGFSDPDILQMYTVPPLPVSTLTAIREAALQHMAGWNTRVIAPIHNLLQSATATEMGALVGRKSKWVPSGPGSGNTFESWASASTEGAAPPVAPSTTINCWEMVLLAANRAGTLTWRWIHESYTASGAATGGNWSSYLARRLTPAGRQSYNRAIPSGPAPARGDIVMWNGIDHVALAVGRRDGTGRVEVYSFWPPPIGSRPDEVKVTTIEELADYMEAGGLSHAPTPVEFGPGPW
jgi:hypothetical protein